MNDLTLVIGSKRTSSWSLRPWLLMRVAGIDFEEVIIELRRPETRDRIRDWSPSGKVPLLVAHGVRIWDSLGIAEFLAELQPGLWPEDTEARAIARSVSAEMHSGFADLRAMLPMDTVSRFGPPGRLTRGTAADIQRIIDIWRDCRDRFGADGPFLFGHFSIADAMFAPVCSRFTTYAVPLDETSQRYVATIMGLPAMRAWIGEPAAAGDEAPTRMAPRAPAPPPAIRPEPAPATVAAVAQPVVEPSRQTPPIAAPPDQPATPPPPMSAPPPPPVEVEAAPPPELETPPPPRPTPEPAVVQPTPRSPEPPPSPPRPPPRRDLPPAAPSRGLPEFRFRSLFRSSGPIEEAEPEHPVARVDEHVEGPMAPTIAQGRPPAPAVHRDEPAAEAMEREPPAADRPVPRPEAERRPRPLFDIGTIKPIGDGIRRRR